MNPIDIRNIKCFVLDMDGTIYLGNELFPFTMDFLNTVEATGREFYFFTNNSSRDLDAYIKRLDGFGIHISPRQMMTATHVAIRYLQKNYPDKLVYIMGTPALVSEMKRSGVRVLEDVDCPYPNGYLDAAPDIVVIGFDQSLTYDKLVKATHYVRNGAIYFGVNQDWNCPIENGNFLPDCGSMAKLIEASTGRWPEFFGKPSRYTLDYIVEATGLAPSQIAVVGDRLYTDIAVAAGSDVCSVLVLTGEATRKEAEAGIPVKPDLIFESLADITEIIR